jgi:hypothetical protein
MSTVSGIVGADLTINFNPGNGNRLVALAGPLRIRIASRSPILPAQLCKISA